MDPPARTKGSLVSDHRRREGIEPSDGRRDSNRWIEGAEDSVPTIHRRRAEIPTFAEPILATAPPVSAKFAKGDRSLLPPRRLSGQYLLIHRP